MIISKNHTLANSPAAPEKRSGIQSKKSKNKIINSKQLITLGN